MCTALGILCKGNQNCDGGELSNDLFGRMTEKPTAATEETGKSAASEGVGRVLDQQEQLKPKEEVKKEQPKEDNKPHEEEPKEEHGDGKPTWLQRTLTGLKNFGKKMVAPDDER